MSDTSYSAFQDASKSFACGRCTEKTQDRLRLRPPEPIGDVEELEDEPQIVCTKVTRRRSESDDSEASRPSDGAAARSRSTTPMSNRIRLSLRRQASLRAGSRGGEAEGAEGSGRELAWCCDGTPVSAGACSLAAENQSRALTRRYEQRERRSSREERRSSREHSTSPPQPPPPRPQIEPAEAEGGGDVVERQLSKEKGTKPSVTFHTDLHVADAAPSRELSPGGAPPAGAAGPVAALAGEQSLLMYTLRGVSAAAASVEDKLLEAISQLRAGVVGHHSSAVLSRSNTGSTLVTSATVSTVPTAALLESALQELNCCTQSGSFQSFYGEGGGMEDCMGANEVFFPQQLLPVDEASSVADPAGTAAVHAEGSSPRPSAPLPPTPEVGSADTETLSSSSPKSLAEEEVAMEDVEDRRARWLERKEKKKKRRRDSKQVTYGEVIRGQHEQTIEGTSPAASSKASPKASPSVSPKALTKAFPQGTAYADTPGTGGAVAKYLSQLEEQGPEATPCHGGMSRVRSQNEWSLERVQTRELVGDAVISKDFCALGPSISPVLLLPPGAAEGVRMVACSSPATVGTECSRAWRTRRSPGHTKKKLVAPGAYSSSPDAILFGVPLREETTAPAARGGGQRPTRRAG